MSIKFVRIFILIFSDKKLLHNILNRLTFHGTQKYQIEIYNVTISLLRNPEQFIVKGNVL